MIAFDNSDYAPLAPGTDIELAAADHAHYHRRERRLICRWCKGPLFTEHDTFLHPHCASILETFENTNEPPLTHDERLERAREAVMLTEYRRRRASDA